MAVAEAPRRRHRRPDRVHELTRSCERMRAAPTHDLPCDLAREAFLAELPKDVGELPLVGLVDEVARRTWLGWIHAHVERGVDRIGEAALGAIDLHAGDAE